MTELKIEKINKASGELKQNLKVLDIELENCIETHKNGNGKKLCNGEGQKHDHTE